MKIGQIYRTARPYSSEPEFIDGIRNYFAETAYLNYAKCTLEKGVNPIQKVSAVDGERRPAILLRSSPHKYETEDTPWVDAINLDLGHVTFFGDNKKSDKAANQSKGNRALLEQIALQSGSSRNDRELASPIFLFESISRNGIQKGQVRFCGLAKFYSLEKIVQCNPRNDHHFENFKFTFLLMDLSKEGGDLDWRWINERRNPNLKLEESNRFAPKSWKRFLSDGF